MPSIRRPRPAPSARARAGLASLATATGLNVALLWAASAAMVPPAAGSPGGVRMTVLPAPTRSGASTVEPPVAVRPAGPVRAVAGPRSARPAPRFFTTAEVDRPAAPVDDWNLAVDDLDGLGTERLVFDVAVDAAGRIVDCLVLEPASLPSAGRLAIEAKLGATAMQPATRHHADVASRRRIEISMLAMAVQPVDLP